MIPKLLQGEKLEILLLGVMLNNTVFSNSLKGTISIIIPRKVQN